MVGGEKLEPTFGPGHGDDFALEGAGGEVPLAFVDTERGLSSAERVLVRFGDEPGGRVLGCES